MSELCFSNVAGFCFVTILKHDPANIFQGMLKDFLQGSYLKKHLWWTAYESTLFV